MSGTVNSTAGDWLASGRTLREERKLEISSKGPVEGVEPGHHFRLSRFRNPNDASSQATPAKRAAGRWQTEAFPDEADEYLGSGKTMQPGRARSSTKALLSAFPSWNFVTFVVKGFRLPDRPRCLPP